MRVENGARLRTVAAGGGRLLLLLGLVLAPLSLRAQVRFSELMYHPLDGKLEFIELFNAGDTVVDMSGWELSDGVSYTFPAGVLLGSGERLVICRDRAALAAAQGLESSELLGNYEGALSNGGETVALSDAQGNVIEEFEYDDNPPFDPAADGTGLSLERICFSAAPWLPSNWRASAQAGGSPLAAGGLEACPPPLPRVTSPIVINEIHYHPLDDADATEEFVELYNRSDEPVDLHLWWLEGGIAHTFDRNAEPTMVAPRGFLLVARDPAGLAALSGVPQAEIAGPFRGGLSNFREDLELRFPGGLADRVEYAQEGLWPARADGLGASLQRISAEVAGYLPQNWTVTSRDGCTSAANCVLFENGADVRWFENADGSDPGFSGGLPWYHPDFDDVGNNWRDGRLAVGYDTRVPDGQPWVLTRSSAIDGLHSILLRIEFFFDPEENPCGTSIPHLSLDWDDGYVAWLNGVEVSRGGMVDPPGAVPPFDGSYRAEIVTAGGFRQDAPVYQQAWIGTETSLRPGRNVLAVGNYNSRSTSSDLYLTARATLGPSAVSGELTPGTTNSVAAATVPPLIFSAEHDPAQPTSSDPVVITAAVDTPGGVEVEVFHDRGAGEESAPMRDDGQGGDVTAGDGVYTAILPPAPHLALVKYRVKAGGPAGCGAAFPREGNPSRYTGYFVADDRPAVNEDVRLLYIFTPGALTDLTCTEGVYRQGTFVDFRGRVYFDVGVKYRGETACNYPKKPLRVRFNKGDSFDGQKRLNFMAGWNDKAMLREKLAFDFFRDAGVPYSETHLTRIHTNRGAFYGCFFSVEDPNSDYLRRNGWDDDGALYKCRTPMLNSSTSGYESRTDAADERLADVASFAGSLNSLSGDALLDFLDQNLNVEEMIDYQAVQVIIIDGDSVVKNWLLYVGPHGPSRSGPDLFACFAWDVDLSHGQMYLTQDQRHHNIHPLFQTQTYPFVGQGHHGIVHALLERAPDDYYVKAYYGRMWTLLQEKYNPAILLPRIDAYDAQTLSHVQDDLRRWPRTWGSNGTNPAFWRNDLRAWLQRRFDYLTRYLQADNPTTRGRRFQYTPAPRIKFTEIHYHPNGPENLEFLELYNLEEQEVDIGGWHMPLVRYTFPPLSKAPANGFLIVARDPAAFAAAHPHLPDGVAIFGPYSGALPNGGAQLRLRDNGLYRGRQYHPETIDVVSYDDSEPWPAGADGEGGSLELRALGLDNDYSLSWQVSRAYGGSPGGLTVTNRPPVVALDISPARGVVPLRVTFDASASFDPDGDEFTVRWDFSDGVVGAGEQVSRTYRQPGTYGGTVTLDDGISAPAVESFEVEALAEPGETRFVRGDVNADGILDISDSVRLLLGLFAGATLDCERSADADDSGSLEVTDAVVLLDYLFRLGGRPAAPYPECGLDVTDDPLSCLSFERCE